jgi:predicted RNA-binding protein with PIN domain
MHILIDGYNVLKQVLHDGQISQKQRRAFIALLGKYAEKKNHSITLIFDGGPLGIPSQEKDHGIKIIYSGSKKSADDVIIEFLQGRSHGLLLVSSDNALRSHAASRGLISIDATEFYALLRISLQSKKEQQSSASVVKTTQEKNALIDELMMKNIEQIQKPEIDYTHNRIPGSHTSSKKERAYLQKIKKL